MSWFKRRPGDDSNAPDYYLHAIERMEAVVDRWETYITWAADPNDPATLAAIDEIVARREAAGWEPGDALTEAVQDAAWGEE